MIKFSGKKRTLIMKNPIDFSHLSSSDISFIDSLYDDYKTEANSVDESWQKFFEGFEFAAGSDTGGGGDFDEGRLGSVAVAHLDLGVTSRVDDEAPDEGTVPQNSFPHHQHLAIDGDALAARTAQLHGAPKGVEPVIGGLELQLELLFICNC